MAREFDLLGDLIPENHDHVGRTGHVVTPESVNKVRQLVIAGWTGRTIAAEIGITGPTLTKHYFNQRSIKEAKCIAISEVKGRIFLQLSKAASSGNVAAMKEMRRIIEKEELALLSDAYGDAAPKKSKLLGKKEQRKVDANKSDEKWDFLLGDGPVKH